MKSSWQHAASEASPSAPSICPTDAGSAVATRLTHTANNIRHLRERALLSRDDLAKELSLSVSVLYNIEVGKVATRVNTLYQIALVLAYHLEEPPSQVFDAIIPDALYAEVEPIRAAAADYYATLGVQDGNLNAKRKFARRHEVPKLGAAPPEVMSYTRIQKLFAGSYYTQKEICDLAGLSYRRLNDFLSYGAAKTGNMTVALFLKLVAALAPTYREGATVKKTVFYVLGGDLARLDERYYEQRAEHIT